MKIEYEIGNKFSGFEWYDSYPDRCIVSRVSPYSGVHTNAIVYITYDQYKAWRLGIPIQTAFPNLTVDEREFILTGLLGDEFEKHMGLIDEDGNVIDDGYEDNW